MARWLKVLALALLLMAATFVFGRFTTGIEHLAARGEVVGGSAPEGMRSLAVAFGYALLAMGLVAFASGLAAPLLRPYWVAAIAFALAGALLWIGLGGGLRHGVLALAFFLFSLLYTWSVSSELANRIHFSVKPLGESQGILLLALTVVVSAGFYFGYDSLIRREGFTIPPATLDMAMKVVQGQLEAQPQLKPEEREKVLGDLRREIERQLKEQVEVKLKPYERLIPIGIAISLFLTLRTALTFLTWIPVWGLRLAFPLLRAIRFARVATETREVSRLEL